MPKVTCYDTSGKEHIKQPVDARECIDTLGWTLTKPEPKVKKETAAQKKARIKLEESELEKTEIVDPESK